MIATRLYKRFVARPFSTAVLVVAVGVLAIASVAAARTVVSLSVFSARAQALATRASSPAGDTAIVHFPFRGRTRFVHVTIAASEVEAARRLDTSRVFASARWARGTYVRTLVDASSRSGTVEQIASELRGMRDELALDDDAYLELIARFVQEIPYGTVDRRVRPPVEVIAEGAGVCDDKSLLLAALLVHEGYDTAVWAFDAQAHAAVGVRCVGPGMQGSGYAFVETTGPAFVGQVRGTLGSYAMWRGAPQLVKVGGSTRYTADSEAEFVARTLERARRTARQLERYRELAHDGPVAWRPTYAAIAREQAAAQHLANLGDVANDDRARLFALLTAGGSR